TGVRLSRGPQPVLFVSVRPSADHLVPQIGRTWLSGCPKAISISMTLTSHSMALTSETARGRVMNGAAGRDSFEPDLSRAQIHPPNWGQMALDIHVAARTKVPVLISAAPDCAVNVARAIAAFTGTSK